jgi:hypothetical protein
LSAGRISACAASNTRADDDDDDDDDLGSSKTSRARQPRQKHPMDATFGSLRKCKWNDCITDCASSGHRNAGVPCSSSCSTHPNAQSSTPTPYAAGADDNVSSGGLYHSVTTFCVYVRRTSDVAS